MFLGTTPGAVGTRETSPERGIEGMNAEPTDAVTFSYLSRNPRAVAERARRLGRLRITHRDAQDF